MGPKGNIHWHSDTSADEHYDHSHAEESKEEVGIERLVLKSIGIGDLPERAYPIEESCWEGCRAFPVAC